MLRSILSRFVHWFLVAQFILQPLLAVVPTKIALANVGASDTSSERSDPLTAIVPASPDQSLVEPLIGVAETSQPEPDLLSRLLTGLGNLFNPDTDTSDHVVFIDDRVSSALFQSAQTQVIIHLDISVPADAPADERRAAVARAQDAVLQAVSGQDFQVYRRYTLIPALAGTLNEHALAGLQHHPAVLAITPDEIMQADLGQAVPALGADVVHNTYGLTGQGVNVALLDTGIDTDHPDLSDDIVASTVSPTRQCPPSYNATESTSAEDDHGHGSANAGIVTANGVRSNVGFAPDAGIVMIKVLDRNGSRLFLRCSGRARLDR
jgi:subtilisin family serine protease